MLKLVAIKFASHFAVVFVIVGGNLYLNLNLAECPPSDFVSLTFKPMFNF